MIAANAVAIYPSLHNKAVLITGGATGIGEALVRRFAQAQTRVAFLDIQDDAARKLVDSVAAGGASRPVYLRTDVTDIAAVEAAFDSVRHALGPISVLVNNAANDAREAFDSVTAESFDASLSVNLKHMFFAARAYSAAKAAIVGLTNSLARQLGPDNIRVNAVAPGAVLTERQLRLWMNPEAVAKIMEQQCLHERLEADHIADAVLFLAADDSRMITKQCLFVNAGLR
jgi:NAD(P)-dependent dehydrogenase (short-subunit alcohol dehydrogenase family)